MRSYFRRRGAKCLVVALVLYRITGRIAPRLTAAGHRRFCTMSYFVAVALLLLTNLVLCSTYRGNKRNNYSWKVKPLNILEILVDDLGYGDTSVAPFIGLNVNTPNLQRMAAKGTILTNYHTAAATCTPTRASILTGLYPWRLGIKSVFEYGERGSNRNDWLVAVPTIPMVLREANYSVTHSGKWHLGGMRNDDYDMRLLPAKAGRRCPHPGPNQQGFKNYISVLDGPGSPRQNRLQLNSELYSHGCSALLRNDIDIGQGPHNITGYLSFCEAEHAMYAMNSSVARGRPFFIQLWFHAPHAPLQGIPGYPEYQKKDVRMGSKLKDGTIPYQTKNVSFNEMGPTWKYRSMIADMDHQLGRLLTNLEVLGIEKDTLVVFTSDNGPENSAGTTAGFREKKRSLYEGGIRVPAIVQWVGTVPAGQASDAFVASTDLFPTFLDAAGVMAPAHLRLDGLSILPLLVPDYYKKQSIRGTSEPILNNHNFGTRKATDKHVTDVIKDDANLYRTAMRDRITLWHNDYEGKRRTAAWLYDFKVILDERERMFEMYDMKSDRFETANLLAGVGPAFWVQVNTTAYTAEAVLSSDKSPLRKVVTKQVTLKMLLEERSNPGVHVWLAAHVYKLMQDYVRGGNLAHQLVLRANPGWFYTPTVLSDYRHDFIDGPVLTARASGRGAEEDMARLLAGSCGSTPCPCELRTARQVAALPFEKVPQYAYLSPGKLHDFTSFISK
jgi:arylsulfatase A-like enzyme